MSPLKDPVDLRKGQILFFTEPSDLVNSGKNDSFSYI